MSPPMEQRQVPQSIKHICHQMQSLFIKRHVDYNGYYACYYWQSWLFQIGYNFERDYLLFVNEYIKVRICS